MVAAREAHEQAPAGEHVVGWKLDPAQRARLLRRFAPAYPRAVADHVTLKPRVARGSVLPRERDAAIIGRTDDGHGVEALVVQIEGSTSRPDGGTYHITWSLATGRRPKDSNDAIAAHGWEPIDPPVRLRLAPAVFR